MNIFKKIFGGLDSDARKTTDNLNKDPRIRIQFENFDGESGQIDHLIPEQADHLHSGGN